MVNQIGQLQAAKAELRETLTAEGGDTNNAVVIDKIDQLCNLNPTLAPAHSDRLESNEWLLISAPNFPQGKQLPNGQFSYTLGRLAFNLFEPTGLNVVIDRVRQPVVLLGQEEQRSHDIIVEFTIVDESYPKLSGIVLNQGICYPISHTVLQVQFTGGRLAPQDPTNLDDWKAVFSQQKPSQKSWQEKFTSLFLKLMFGLAPPDQMDSETGELSFTMNRSPKGRLAILYLDEELRITRGERGTILVCERSD